MSFSLSLPSNATTINIASTLGTVLASGFVGAGLVATYWIVPAVILPVSPSPTPSSAQLDSQTQNNNSDSKVANAHRERQRHMARQWRDFFDKGKKWGPLAGTSAAASWLLAAAMVGKLDSGLGVGFGNGDGNAVFARNLYVAAAVLSMVVAPYTVVVMGKVNGELLRRAGGDGEMGGKETVEEGLRTKSTEELLVRWSELNLGRVLFPVVGLACVVYARIL